MEVVMVAVQPHPVVSGAGNSMTIMTLKAMILPIFQHLIVMIASLPVEPIPIVGLTPGQTMSAI